MNKRDLFEYNNPCYFCKNARGHKSPWNCVEALVCVKNYPEIEFCTYLGSCEKFERVDKDEESRLVRIMEESE